VNKIISEIIGLLKDPKVIGVIITLIFRDSILLIITKIIRKVSGMKFTNSGYTNNYGERFCSGCFDDKLKLIHLKQLNETCWGCPKCKENYRTEL
jgi:hypothetical protein